MELQAKDIQKILNIPKHRYEYIASKIGIRPEEEEVEGQGRAHLYSFKNLLQFAFVHHASRVGLSPKAARKMLLYLEDFGGGDIFDEGKEADLLFQYIKSQDSVYIAIGKDVIKEKSYEIFHKVKKEKITMTAGKSVKLPEEDIDDLNKRLNDAEVYLTINLGIIKKRILRQLPG